LALEEPGNYIGDVRFSVNNMTLVYENRLSRYFEGKVLDYKSGHHGSEFKVNDFRE
jgi:Fe-S cluster assembly iron-binding protein IscA